MAREDGGGRALEAGGRAAAGSGAGGRDRPALRDQPEDGLQVEEAPTRGRTEGPEGPQSCAASTGAGDRAGGGGADRAVEAEVPLGSAQAVEAVGGLQAGQAAAERGDGERH